MWLCSIVFKVVLTLVLTRQFHAAEEVSYRLPNDTRPITYDIHLETNVHTGETKFTGHVDIDIQVVQTTKEIVLHTRGHNITAVKLSTPSNPNQEFEITTSYDNVTEFLAIESNEILLVDQIYRLAVNYEGNLRVDDFGFYIQTYTNSLGKSVYLATTQFEATEARHAFPCFDEPNKKAIFKIKITHGSNYNAISNMPAVSVTPNGDGTTTTAFQPTTLMSPSVLGWTVSDFIFSEKIDRIPHRIYSKRNFEKQHKFALETSVALLNYLSDYLEIDYPLPKIDNVAIPNKIGGMENWGMLAYGERFLLYNEDDTTTTAHTAIAAVMTHEISHQWFGNLVSFSWWTYSWMKEAFASYFEWFIMDKIYPEWDIMQGFITRYFRDTLNVDARANSLPLTHYIESPEDLLSRVFDLIPYGKGASFMRMIQHVFGENSFRKALVYYLKEMKYTTVTEDDFFRALRITAVEENIFDDPNAIDDWLKSWTHQPGYPLVTVTRDYTQGTILVSQDPYDGTNKTNPMDKRSWWIPFNFATASNPDFDNTRANGYILPGTNFMIVEQENEKWTNEDWVIFNKQATGFYRVNYDNQNWQLIAQALRKNVQAVNKFNRAILMEDAYQLARAKILDYDVLFELMTYLKNETDYAPWAIANSILIEVESKLRADTEYNKFRFFLRKITENFYKLLTVNEKPTDAHLVKTIRSSIVNLACRGDIANCLEESNQRLIAIPQEGQIVEPNLRSTILCTGMMKGTVVEMRLILQFISFIKEQNIRNEILSGIGCMRGKDWLKSYLERSLESQSDLSNNERMKILDYVVMNGASGLSAAIEFLMSKHKQYMQLSSNLSQNNPVLSAIRSIATRIYSKSLSENFEALLKVLKDVEGITADQLQMVRSTVQNNIAWRNSDGEMITKWMTKFYDENGGKEEEGGGGGDGATSIVTSTSILAIIVINILRIVM